MSVNIMSKDDITQLYQAFISINKGDISKNDKENLRTCLQRFPKNKLSSMDDHRKFVELVKLYREVVIEDMQFVGTNFINMINGMLTVGEEGLYSNKLRFLYELIQNVDDCDYEKIDDSDLKVEFRWEKEPGRIVLTYNEKGFTPGNVFDITGIAEKSKNVDAKKMEIGEKGIGFKSVFGVADKVHIRSGNFSFVLDKDNFTVPHPAYDDFSFINGTKMELYMSSSKVREIYTYLIKQYYNDKNSILNNNPILFLNKLTHIWMGFDGFRYIDFKVTRKKELGGKFEVEKNVEISMDYYDHGQSGIDKEDHRNIKCYRYYMPIEYDRKACESRYGKDTTFENRRMAIIAIVPMPEYLMEFGKGRFYSFLPTGIKLNAPMALHAPFKLAGSREYVDPQDNNKWFSDTLNAISRFYVAIYKNLAKHFKNKIVQYLPDSNEYWWVRDNQKVDCLCIDKMRGKVLSSNDIFVCEDNEFRSASKVISFAADDFDVDQKNIYKYLGVSKKLFIPSVPLKMDRFGVETIKNLYDSLYAQLMEKSDFKSEIYHLLIDKNYNLRKKLLRLNTMTQFDSNHLSVIAADKDVFNVYKSVFGSKEFIEKNKIVLKCQDYEKLDDKNLNIIFELMEDVVLNSKIKNYISSKKDYIYVLPGDNDRFFFMASNAIVVSKEAPLKAFGFLVQEYDEKNTFSATLKLRQASLELDNVNDDVSDEEYLDALINVRTSIMNAFGRNVYGKYIQLINEAGTDSSRFVQELLQNADDCNYSNDDEVPYFNLKTDKNILTVKYNEDGFTKKNVRAITAIGESTKKLLYSDSLHSIGEKGVGFKSVFSVADKVQIHSNSFHFELTDKKPTVPSKCKAIGNENGTTMIFSMKRGDGSFSRLEKNELLRLVLCLRKLKKITVNGINIDITDGDKERIVSIDGKDYHFEKYVYEFEIKDSVAIAERNKNGKDILPFQKITVYIPDNSYKGDNYLYSGLPLSTKALVPLLIDAPFELTTSRDMVLENRWNNIIIGHMYDAIIEIMDMKKDELGSDIFKFIHVDNNNGIYTNSTFDNKYINSGFNFIEKLKNRPLLKVYDEDIFIRPSASCLLIPTFLIRKNYGVNLNHIFSGTVIDIKNNRHNALLKLLGCSQASMVDVFECLKYMLQETNNSIDFVKSIYSYLASDEVSKLGQRENISRLPIFPIRESDGVRFIPFNNEIYFADKGVSQQDYYILETDILSYDMFCKITGNTLHINKLTQDVLDKKYQDSLVNIIKSDSSLSRIAGHLLFEYNHNFEELRKSKYTLRGMSHLIPFKMEDGSFRRNPKFINTEKNFFDGTFLPALCVDEEYEELAKFLEIDDLYSIVYDDIPNDIDSLTSEDIDDIKACFNGSKYVELIKGLYEDGYISDELMESNGLEFARDDFNPSEDIYENEDFPSKSVKDLGKLKNHIYSAWNGDKNPYIKKQYTMWTPQYTNKLKYEYLYDMYYSEIDKGYCFCQMCGRKTPKKYTEANDLEREPVYAWSQMYLLFCLECSKDYKSYRNDDKIWNDFVYEIMNTDVLSDNFFDLPLGDKTIGFTAVHLAEIQEILKCEGWPDLPKRDG